MEIEIYEGILFPKTISKICPNTEWDHYVDFEEITNETPKRKRGRPKGSKNKKKIVVDNITDFFNRFI